MKGSHALGLAALGGAALALATPPTNAYLGAWLGLALLAYALDEPSADATRFATHDGLQPELPRLARRRRFALFFKRAFVGGGRGFAFGFAVNVVGLRFVPSVVTRFTPLPWVAGVIALLLLAGLQATGWCVAGVVRAVLTRRGAPAWAAFAAGVYAATFVPTVFPWSPAGTVTPWPAMVQLADVVGERGVSAMMALTAGLLASAIRAFVVRREGGWARAAGPCAAGLAIPIAMAAHGAICIRRIGEIEARAPTAKIALLQPSVDALERWDETSAEAILKRLTDLTASAERRGPELTVWPEDAYPRPVAHATRRCPQGAWAILPGGVHGPVLTGLVMTGGHGDLYNSAAVCSADGTLSEPYDKVHLLWFGETIPVLDRIPWIRATFTRGTGMLPGDKSVLLRVGRVHAAILNCFEDTLPEAGREAMSVSPNLLVNLTNDAWFAGSAESEIHLRLSALRAVESRRDLVRAVNRGPTSWIDAAGKVRMRYVADIPGTLLAEPALLETQLTFFTRWGDGPGVLFAMVAALLLVVRARRTPTEARHGSP